MASSCTSYYEGNWGTLKLHPLSMLSDIQLCILSTEQCAMYATVSRERTKWFRNVLWTTCLYHEHVKLLKSNFNHSSIRRIGRKVTRNRKAFKHMKKPKHISCEQKEWTHKHWLLIFWSPDFQPIRYVKECTTCQLSTVLVVLLQNCDLNDWCYWTEAWKAALC